MFKDMPLTDKLGYLTQIRRAMLANGYVPLANDHKACMLKGWPSLRVDDDLIEEWSTKGRYLGTGVRIEGGLVAVDIDIDDVEVIDAIFDALPDDLYNRMIDAPTRYGRGEKIAVFMRLAEGEEAFERRASAGYRSSEESDDVQRVEIFASTGGKRQFGAYGAHTIRGGEVVVEYRWVDGRGLCEVPLAELPVVTRAECELICDTASAVLKRLGWVHDLKSKEGFSKSATVYDLTDDMVFDTIEGDELSLADLEASLGVSGSVRVSASFIEGPSARNATRCIAGVNHDGRLAVWDSATCQSHRPKDLERLVPNEAALSRLMAMDNGKLFEKSGAPKSDDGPVAVTQGEAMSDDLDLIVDALLHDYAYCPTETQQGILPIFEGAEGAMSKSSFLDLMLPRAVAVEGPRGGVKVVNPASLWMADQRRTTVSGHRFRPDLPDDRIIEDGGRRYINSYIPQQWDEVTSADVATVGDAFEQLLAHLCPEQVDRDWFRMWLASKIQRPDLPNCGVLLIADEQGTGRGTLFDMMRAAVGSKYYRSIGSTELLGTGGQGVWTDWAAATVLVVVEEVMAGADSGSHMGWKRQEAYERIKQLIDPRSRVMEIRRKGRQNYAQDVFFSVLMATNHADALPLSHNDRRIAVIHQPDIKFDDVPELVSAVNPWRVDRSFDDVFGAALRTHLLAVEVDFSQLRNAPELSGGRDEMRDNNEGEVEDILRDVLDKIPSDYILNSDLKRRMKMAVAAAGDDDDLRGWWKKAEALLRGANAFGWRRMSKRQRYGEGNGSFGTVFYRTEAGVAEWEDAGWIERRDVLLAPASDINRTLSEMERRMRETGIKPVK